MGVGARALGAMLVLVLAAAVAAQAQAAGPAPVPLSSPAPGSPVFVSFKSAYDGNFTTNFAIQATGSDLAYVWTLQNVTCGTLVNPQGRGATNAYAHEGCPTAGELVVRVSVLVMRASDMQPNGAPKSDDVPRFLYSQIARAQDSTDTANVPAAPLLQYFGPAPGAASPGATQTASTGPLVEGTGSGTDWLGPAGGFVLFLIAVGLGEYVLSRDDCDWLKKLCERAKVEAAARAREARDAHTRANAARSRCNDANREADRLRRAAEDADKPPSEGSYIEDPDTGRRITSRDLHLEGAADRAAYDDFRAGKLTGQQYQDAVSKWGDPEKLKDLRDKDDAARAAKSKAAHDAADGAKAKADEACKDADQAALAAEQADQLATEMEHQAEEICDMVARLCPDEPVAQPPLPPMSPTPPTPPTPPTTPTTPQGPVTTPGDDDHRDHTSHQYKLEHHQCCESGEYYGYAISVEAASLPIVSKLLSALTGEWSETDWFQTGFDFWKGSIYCSSDTAKFASFEAKAPRGGLAIGGGGGITYIHCKGRNHPQEVIDDIPSMMSGWGGDIPGIGSAVSTVKASGTAAAAALKSWRLAGSTLKELMQAFRGFWWGVTQSAISSQVQGAEKCLTATFDLTVQAGIWKVHQEKTVVACRDYGCCFDCSKYVDRGGYGEY